MMDWMDEEMYKTKSLVLKASEHAGVPDPLVQYWVWLRFALARGCEVTILQPEKREPWRQGIKAKAATAR